MRTKLSLKEKRMRLPQPEPAYKETVVFEDIKYSTLTGDGLSNYIKRLYEVDDLIGRGNFRAEWEMFGNDRILAVTVYNEADHTFLKLRFGV